MSNRLYFGDCLDVMREDIPNESVDLIYLDPPFNSNRLYNAFIDGAQWVAFDDTWQWHRAVDDFHEVAGDVGMAGTMKDLRLMLGEGPQLAYLSYMANRLRECRRVLKSTGSIYLHCDPTMSHYLKAVMDGIFGRRNFVNEIVWKRSDAKGDGGQGAKHFGRVNDIIFLYGKGSERAWNRLYAPLDSGYVERFYKYQDSDGRRYKLDNMLGPGGAAKGNPQYEVMGVTRHWRYSKDRMKRLIDAGRVVQRKPGNVPMYKRYLDESKGTAITTN